MNQACWWNNGRRMAPEQVVPYGVIVGSLLKLVPLAYNEIKEAYFVKDEFLKLKDTLESINIVLLNAAQDQVTKHWIRRFQQVLHSADYLMDGLAIKILKHRLNVARENDWALFVEDMKRPFCSIELNHKIKEIRKSIDYVSKDSFASRLILSPEVPRRHKEDNNSAFVESEVVGMEDDKRKIIEKLRKTQEEDRHISLLAIVGIGGTGKSTVANLVYNDAEVKSAFTKLIWVSVSHDFEVKTILKKMLKYLNHADVGDLELPILEKMINEELSGQKYMLVLEDVWNEAPLKWDALRTHLMCGGNGSVILVTTRSKRVALTMSTGMSEIDLHVLEGLTEEHSWDLFKKVITDENVKMSSNFESIREIVVKRCRGVPVAIKTMGCYLNCITDGGRSKSGRLEGHEWMKTLEGDIWKFYEKIDDKSIMPLLILSFQNLSYKLRQCFAYCYLYPKGWKIYHDELIQLWMAQGYLKEDQSMSLENMGKHFVNELKMGLFFQEKEDEYGQAYYQMHDLMHDLATSVAGDDYYLDGQGKGNTIRTPMHISFLSGCDVQSLGSLKGSKPRTILGHKLIDKKILATLHTKTELKYVLALDLSNTSITKVPKFIRECKRLRYLNLSNCSELTSLPKWLKYRILLQTLRINGCPKLVCSGEEIIKLIADLKSLKNLYIDESKDPYLTGNSVEDEEETSSLLHRTKTEEARAKIFIIPNNH